MINSWKLAKKTCILNRNHIISSRVFQMEVLYTHTENGNGAGEGRGTHVSGRDPYEIIWGIPD